METAVSKRERDGRDRGVTAPNGNGGGEPRKRPRSRFAPAETDGAAPSAPSASDELSDLDKMIAAAKAQALQKSVQAQKAAAIPAPPPPPPPPPVTNGAKALAAAAAAAATRGHALAGFPGVGGLGLVGGGVAPAAMAARGPVLSGFPGGGRLGMGGSGAPQAEASAAQAAAKAAEMAALAAKIRASLSNATLPAASMGPIAGAEDDTNGLAARSKKAQDHTLRLDEQGRQVDAEGKLVRQGPVLTLKANRLGGKAHNPYLQHSTVDETDATQVVDPRVQTGSRDKRAKRAFNFVEEGTYVKQGENLRFREHRKLISGRLSGRKRAEQLDAAEGEKGSKLSTSLAAYGSAAVEEVGGVSEAAAAAAGAGVAEKDKDAVPPLREAGDEAVETEWWDEAFLTREMRDEEAGGKLAPETNNVEALYEFLKLENSKFYAYVQHPKKQEAAVTASAVAGGKATGTGGVDVGEEAAMKVYLTKKERKRIRRTTRMEREREKQDKIALGLLPPPEPKMKMSNFMQVLGDQAVVDPSKIEALVMGQVARRKAEHDARNQAAKLTPQEKREKKKRKLLEDTSKELQVAVFRVADMTDPKRRFKVDVNARQRDLTGGVVTCTEGTHSGLNMVLVEGGPKAVRAYVKLMTRRIRWEQEEYGGGDSESDSDEETTKPALSGSLCELVWQGAVKARSFNSFKFQECKVPETARRMLEEKGVAHLWDMVMASAKAARDAAAGGGVIAF
ncbi:unnamed protein product [Ascophyllum nodosum]